MINPIAAQFSLFGLNISIHWYGIIIAVGLLLAILLAMHHTKREGFDPDNVLDLALVVVPLAVIGARIYYVLFNWDTVYATQSFWHVFAIWEGGLGIYGAVLFGLLGVWLYTRFINKKMKFITLLDILAPSLILGQAIGRWGNFVNQEAYGNLVTNAAWQWFPASVYIQIPKIQGQVTGWYQATFFYESIWNFLIFGFLFFYYKKSKARKPGDVFWFYLLLYGAGRAVIEGMRTDSLMLGDMRVSQWLSILLALAAAIVLLWPYISPWFMPFARKVTGSVKKSAAERKERQEAAEKAPVDDSLRLISDEDKERIATAKEVRGRLSENEAPADDKAGEPVKADAKEE